MFKKWLFELGVKRRNPSLNGILKDLKSHHNLSLDELKELQLDKLNTIIQYAKNHVPYYAESLKGFEEMQSLSQLKDLPSVTKTDLIEHNADMHSKQNLGSLFFCETSGSTGQILTFHRDEYWDSANRASIFRGYSWYGVVPYEPNIYLWGYNIQRLKQYKTRLLDWLQNRYRIFDYNSNNIARLVRKAQTAFYIHGYSSMIYEMAKEINKSGKTFDFPKLKMVKGTSEKIKEEYKDEVLRAFGKPIISEYGAAESGIIGFECPHGTTHVNMEGVIVETEDDEIVVTNLNAKSFPTIRYKLGDYVTVEEPESACACGMHTQVITSIHGRVGKRILGIKSKYPSLTLYYVFKSLFFNNNIKLNYQCVQTEPGKLMVRLTNEPNKEHEELMLKEFEQRFGNDVEIEIEYTSKLHTYKKKLIDFISELE